jgi:His-Xaa-Ser system protein HxsD
MATRILEISKSNLDELSLRKSLYWIDENCMWKIDENNDYWRINISCDSDTIEKEYANLNALINDYIIRYKLSYDSQITREKIIANALSKLASDD